MKQITHQSYRSISIAAGKLATQILETATCYYFYFNGEKGKHTHIFYKP
jgi:hypothetical protein